MRNVSLVAVAALTLASSACVITTNDRPEAPPPPGPPPAAFAQNAGRAPAGPRVIHTIRRPNVKRLQALKSRGVYCAPEEMASGVWAKFDCQPHTLVRRARPIIHFPTFWSNPQHRSGFVGGPVGNNPSGPVPPAIDLRSAQLDGPIKDQGAVGTCTAVSLSTAMEVAVRKQGKGDVVSALHVWSQYGLSQMGAAGDATENQVLTVEPSWGYDPAKACALQKTPGDECGEAYGVAPGSGTFDPVLQGEKRSADGAGRFRLTQVEEFPKPTNPDQMAAVLAGGDAIWIAMSLDPGAWKNSSMNDGVIPDYSNVGSTGHAITFVGYRTTGSGKQFLIHNSWGPKWGQGGYAWISENMVRQFTRSAYKVVVDGQGGGIPGMPGGGGGDNGGCGAGQARDTVLGNCVAACQSGSAPAAGVCLPAVPGFPIPGRQGPQPQQPGQPAPGGGGCPAGQARDTMSGQCANACPGGAAPIGGMCMPGGVPGGMPAIPGFGQ